MVGKCAQILDSRGDYFADYSVNPNTFEQPRFDWADYRSGKLDLRKGSFAANTVRSYLFGATTFDLAGMCSQKWGHGKRLSQTLRLTTVRMGRLGRAIRICSGRPQSARLIRVLGDWIRVTATARPQRFVSICRKRLHFFGGLVRADTGGRVTVLSQLQRFVLTCSKRLRLPWLISEQKHWIRGKCRLPHLWLIHIRCNWVIAHTSWTDIQAGCGRKQKSCFYMVNFRGAPWSACQAKALVIRVRIQAAEKSLVSRDSPPRGMLQGACPSPPKKCYVAYLPPPRRNEEMQDR